MTLLLKDPTIALDRVRWTQTVRTVQGAPWSFKDREYLFDIYHDESKVIVIKKARQLEITEFLVNTILYYAIERPGSTILYSSARGDQVGRVSRDRVAAAIRTSDYVRPFVLAKDMGVEAIRFQNGSVAYFVSAWGEGDAARNIPADIALIDEVQDVSLASVEAIREGLSHSMLRRLFLVGSPKLAGSEFDMAMWRYSDEHEWIDGKWISVRTSEKTPIYRGYHLSQEMAPWISKEEIEQKRLTYTKQKFENEVLGNFYTGGAVKLTIDQILACADPKLGWDLQTHTPPTYHYAGIDWGDRSYMVIQDRALTMKRVLTWDDRSDLSVVRQAIQQYNIRYLVADMGFGKSEVARLQGEYGYKVWGCQYVDQQQTTFKKAFYKTPDGDLDQRRPVVNANRTEAMDLVYERIYNKKYRFPYEKSMRDTIEWVFQHLLAPYEEFVNSGQHGGLVVKKRYARSGPDHSFHALTYATIAAMMGGGELVLDDKNLRDEEDSRFTKPEYWVQDAELEGWYDFNAQT